MFLVTILYPLKTIAVFQNTIEEDAKIMDSQPRAFLIGEDSIDERKVDGSVIRTRYYYAGNGETLVQEVC